MTNKFKKWSDEENAILINNYLALDVYQLSELVNRSNCSVYAQLAHLGLHKYTLAHWTDEERDILINEYPNKTMKELAKILNKKHGSIASEIIRLNLQKREYRPKWWTEDEKEFLRQKYLSYPINEIAKIMNRTDISVYGQIQKLGLKMKLIPQQIWSKNEIDFLKTNHKSLTAIQISKELNRNINSVKNKCKHLHLTVYNPKIHWSVADIEKLKYYYGIIPMSDLCLKVSKSYNTVIKKIKELNIVKNEISNPILTQFQIFWNPENIQILKDNYLQLDMAELVKKLNTSSYSIRKQMKLLNLCVSNKWTTNEDKILLSEYEFTTIYQLSKKLNRSESSIFHRCKRLGLTTTMEKRNYDFETIMDVAKKCKTRKEFKYLFPNEYKHCRQNKWMDEVCDHMLYQNNSNPQLLLLEILKIILPNCKFKYNDRITIKPLEIDIYIPDYKLGFEYNGKYFHKNKSIQDSNKLEVCKIHDIALIVIHEHEHLHSKYIIQYYIDEIKQDLISHLDIINEKCKLNITDTDINNIDSEYLKSQMFNSLLNADDVKSIISSYEYLSDFKKNEYKLYRQLHRIGILSEYTKDLKRKMIYINIDDVKNTILKYTNYADFKSNESRYYKYLYHHKLLYLLDTLQK